MTKYITIAALLAAGTAFANAAEDYVNLQLPTGQGVQKWSSTGIKTTDGISEDELEKLVSYGTGIFGGPASASDNNISNWATIGDCTVATGQNGYVVDMFGRNGVDGEWFGMVLDTTGKVFDSAKLTLTLPTFSGNDFTIGIVGYSTTSSSVIGWTVEDYTSNGSEVSLILSDLNSTANSVDRLAFIVDGPSGSATTKYQLTGLSFATAPVPEPSAFGLLAGIGALALVASRRRRK